MPAQDQDQDQGQEPTLDDQDQEPPSGNPARPGPAADATRLDVGPGVTHVDPPAAQADSFASWYRQETPLASQEEDANWRPTQTAGYLPSSYPPPATPPPVFPPGPPAPPGRGSRGKGLFIAVAAVVVLAAGGGAYALTSSLSKHPSAQPTARPTVSASVPAAGTTPATGPPATPSNASLTPSPALSMVAISPGVTASAAEPQVETLLSHYFHGINTHNYQEYASTLNAAQLASQSRSRFTSGYASTTDSGMTLTAVSGRGNGGLTATVTFTSHQSPSQSVDNSPCNTWRLNFYLVPHGSSYLIGPEPSGYQPTYSDC